MRGLTVFLLLGLAACSEASLYSVEAKPQVRDDRLTVHGQFCTEVPTPTEFPVRILFIVAISVGVGMITLVAPNFFNQLPAVLKPLLDSGILPVTRNRLAGEAEA